jgi:hypothetical protein
MLNNSLEKRENGFPLFLNVSQWTGVAIASFIGGSKEIFAA